MLPLLKSTVKGPVNHIYKYFSDSNYRQWSLLETRYRLYPRFKPFTTKFANYIISAPDSASFLSSLKSIFLDEIYKFPSTISSPTIIDLGSNIGLSVIYFKKLYPTSKIIAVEAAPDIFQYLTKNIRGNKLNDIQLINKAAWFENTTLNFNAMGGDAGRIAYKGDSSTISVEAIDVSTLFNGEIIDLVKIDIEGAEKIVLEACRKHLTLVNNLIIEYHSKADEEQNLDRILTILHDENFRVHIHTIHSSPNPLTELKSHSGFDLQLNIFAWKK